MRNMECVIIGGGIAGLQAAIQLGRYNHEVIVIDSNQGRSTICQGYHNILGWPDGVSGNQLRALGKKHAQQYGVAFIDDKVVSLRKEGERFVLATKGNDQYVAETVFLATGLVDNIPKLKGLYPCLGKTVYLCPDCDGYETNDKRTIVIGGGNTGAGIANTLYEHTKEIVFVNHTKEKYNDVMNSKLKENKISVIEEEILEVLTEAEGEFIGVRLKNGEIIRGERGFTGFSGNEINNQLAKQAGVKLTENNHIEVSPRTKESNIKGLFAGGDLIAHSELVTIAMGDGAQAAIWIHKKLMGESVP